ncbi:MAG: competence/damage-inducible protein A [Planctomycetota bacterium]
MSAEILAIGSELTCGARLDTNSQWLSRELEALGWTVARHTTLADSLPDIVAELRAAASRSQILLITGGLGPTLDDLTREALADAFQQPLVRDAESVRRIEALFAARGRTMPERNVCQADRPERAETIPNDCGTAPGILMHVQPPGADHRCLIAAMPGVPAEMKPMFLSIRPRLPSSGQQLCRKVIRTFGYGESEAERMLRDLTARGRNPEVGITASEAVISLWISARNPSMETAQQLCQETEDAIRERLGRAVYGEGDVELHDVVTGLLQLQQARVALVEGGTTGGLLAQWFTELPAADTVLEQATVLPGDWSAAGLSHWPAVAQDAASGMLRNVAADYLLLTSPCEDHMETAGVHVRRGLVAVASATTFQTFDVSMSGNLAIFRQRAARTALNQLRLLLGDS